MSKRSTEEWIGKTPNTKIPPRVRLRVFETYGGICAETGRKIMPGDEWDCDHRIALANGGEHRESNLRPVLRDAHRKKTAKDMRIKSKIERVRKKHVGAAQKPAYQRIPGSKGTHFKRRLDGTVIDRVTGKPAGGRA